MEEAIAKGNRLASRTVLTSQKTAEVTSQVETVEPDSRRYMIRKILMALLTGASVEMLQEEIRVISFNHSCLDQTKHIHLTLAKNK